MDSGDATVSGGSLTGIGDESLGGNGESVGFDSWMDFFISAGSITGIGGKTGNASPTKSRGVYSMHGGYEKKQPIGSQSGYGRKPLRSPLIIRLPGAYYWRTSESAAYTQSSLQPYVWDSADTYIDIRTSLPSAGVIGAGGGVGPDVSKAGDVATPMLWLMLALLAAAGLAESAVVRRRRENGQQSA